MAKSTRESRSVARRAAAFTMADVYAALAEGSPRARVASKVQRFSFVPTRMPGFNHAAGIGGLPFGCVSVVFGPSKGGKTTLTAEWIVSVQLAGGIVAFIDVEQSGDTKGWLSALGIDIEQCLYIGRTNPEENADPLTYEEVRQEVRKLRARHRQLRNENKIPWGTPLLIVVDSVSRMAPAKYLKRVKKTDEDSQGRAGVGRDQANMNAEWMLELGADIGSDDVHVALIAHEYQAGVSKNGWTEYKMRGGDSLIYDSMLQIRVTFAGLVYDHTAEDAPEVGKRHTVTIKKSKFGPEFRKATFYTATGEGLAPKGFDKARELVHLGITRGVIKGPTVEGQRANGLTLGSKLMLGKDGFTLKKVILDADLREHIAGALDAHLTPGSIVGAGDGAPGDDE